MNRILIVGILILASAINASAETDIFKDVRMPYGHARSQAAKMADGRACGASNDEIPNARFPAFVKCMSARGWAIARIERDPPPDVRQSFDGPGAAASEDDSSYSAADPSDDGAAALAASQAATQITNDGIAQTVQGSNGP
jgi:hypothetical protein